MADFQIRRTQKAIYLFGQDDDPPADFNDLPPPSACCYKHLSARNLEVHSRAEVIGKQSKGLPHEAVLVASSCFRLCVRIYSERIDKFGEMRLLTSADVPYHLDTDEPFFLLHAESKSVCVDSCISFKQHSDSGSQTRRLK